MLLWLPPSEGKSSPTSGMPLDLDGLLFPALSPARSAVLDALQSLGAGPDAARILGLGKKSAADAAFNLRLREAPCAPALSLYTGVLYDNLNAASLDATAQARLNERTWIMSALFGFVRTTDLIPPHRLSMGVTLPGIGSMAPYWRKELTDTIPTVAGATIVDCRPGAYRAAFPAPEAHLVEIAVVEERAAGRTVITHMAKKWRGLAVRHLVSDSTLGAKAALPDILDSLARLATKTSDSILSVEASESQENRHGGSLTRATLVTRSTERPIRVN